MDKITEALKLAEALENDAKEHREVSYGLDCPPERTANWQHALNCEAAARLIREVLAESKPTPDGRIPKTVFTIDDISKATEMGRLAGMIDALAEPVQEPVAHYKDAPHTIYLQTGCDDPEDCECSFNEWGDTTWCADQIHDTDIPYIRADYAAPVSAPKQEDQEPVERPQNCGTSYCSCIECIYGKDGCVADEEQCNDGCLARESVIANAFKLADEIDAEFFQGRISNHNGRKAAQMLRMLIEAPVQPVKQKPAAFVSDIESGRPLMCDLDEWHQKGLTALYAAPVDAKAIRAEALEEATKWCEAKQSYSAMHANTEFAAGIRGLK